MMVGDQGQIVMGLVMSKYFTYPLVNGDTQFFQENVQKFKESLNLRLASEGGGSFAEMPARKALMPDYVLQQLQAEQQNLQKPI